MSNKKQSSVEYLIKEFSEILGPIKNQPMQDLLLTDAINKAKAMHKEEIEIAFAKSYLIGVEGISYDDANKASAKYYNETYGGNNTP